MPIRVQRMEPSVYYHTRNFFPCFSSPDNGSCVLRCSFSTFSGHSSSLIPLLSLSSLHDWLVDYVFPALPGEARLPRRVFTSRFFFFFQAMRRNETQVCQSCTTWKEEEKNE